MIVPPGAWWALQVPVYAVGIVTGVIAVVAWLGSAVVDIAVAVGAALAAVWAVLSPILLSIWHALDWSFNTVVRPVWDRLKGWADRIWAVYVDHLKPIVDWVSRISKALRCVYQTYIQPVRDLLSILEQFLTLTHLAHTAFGQWLDGELHRIDGTIAKVWADLTKPINLLLHLVNEYILDAKGLLQAPLLLESTGRYMGTIIDQWWEHSLKTIRTPWGKILDEFHVGPNIVSSVDHGRAAVRGEGGNLAPAVDHGLAGFKLLAENDYAGFDYLANGVGGGDSGANV